MPTIYPPPGSIKSIQRGAHNTNVTIAPTNMAKSVLHTSGAASAGTSGENASLIQTAASTLTYNKGSLPNSPTVAWILVEYY